MQCYPLYVSVSHERPPTEFQDNYHSLKRNFMPFIITSACRLVNPWLSKCVNTSYVSKWWLCLKLLGSLTDNVSSATASNVDDMVPLLLLSLLDALSCTSWIGRVGCGGGNGLEASWMPILFGSSCCCCRRNGLKGLSRNSLGMWIDMLLVKSGYMYNNRLYQFKWKKKGYFLQGLVDSLIQIFGLLLFMVATICFVAMVIFPVSS